MGNRVFVMLKKPSIKVNETDGLLFLRIKRFASKVNQFPKTVLSFSHHMSSPQQVEV